MRFAGRNSLALAGAALAATVPVLLGATAGSASRSTAVSCGETLMASVTLTADLPCGGSSGLAAGKDGITINLNGHFVSGSSSAPIGIDASTFSGVTIENGNVLGFATGVSASGGDGVHILKLKIVDASSDGIDVSGGTGALVSGNFVAASGGIGINVFNLPVGPTVTGNYVQNSAGNGIQLNGPTSATVASNTSVSNGGIGISLGAATGKVTGNVANGNTTDGIDANGPGSKPQALTVSGNRASFNGALGISASVELDGGRNVVQANADAKQCGGIVCAEVSG